jgi:hypothetical protein
VPKKKISRRASSKKSVSKRSKASSGRKTRKSKR